MISEYISTSDIHEFYILQETLGEGSFAEVRKAIFIEDGSKFAIKIIDKKRINSSDLRMYINECQILLSLEHPNIIEIYEVYDNPRYFYIVMEYCSGGQLCDQKNLQRCSCEAQIAQIVKTITDTLDFCHCRNIVHRDIKPENILWSTSDEEAVLKIADFGFAKISREQLMTTACGTPMYFSPQILLGIPYDNAVDYWSLGIVVYVLLSGKPPFESEDQLKLFEKIRQGNIYFPERQWKYVSCSAKDFVLHLLDKNPRKRYKAPQIRIHPWILEDNYENGHLESRIENLKQYKVSRNMEKVKFLIEKTLLEINQKGECFEFEDKPNQRHNH